MPVVHSGGPRPTSYPKVCEACVDVLISFQAQLYNDISNHAARNQCAWMYRQLETQNPIEQSNKLLIMY